MGGGDLNLKKSWHPHTMRNQEKVWKAEQAKNAEDRKMNDLRKEIQEEKNREELVKIGQTSGVLAKSDDKKLEWMYKSSTELINREEYLLGRPVDKAFETLAAEEKQRGKDLVGVKVLVNHVEHECIPFSIRAYRNATSTEQVDLQRKILEDPLMMIRQREMESRRKILENPVKLKELHRILKTERTNKSKSKSVAKKSKKSKKSKKKSHGGSDSDGSEDSDKDLDEMLQKRYKKLKGSLDKDSKQLAGLDLSKLLDAKYETISKELDKAAQSKKKKGKSKKKSKNRGSSSDSGSNASDREHNRHQQQEQDHRDQRRFRDGSHLPVERRDSRRDRFQSPGNRGNNRRRMDKSHSPADGRDNRRGKRQSPADRRDTRRDRNESHSPANGRGDRRVRKDRSSSTARRNWNPENRNHLSDLRNGGRSRSRSPRRRDNLYRRSKSPYKRKPSHTSTLKDNREDASKKPTQKERLTEEEKEKRLKDMMDNATWRDKERIRYVQNYRDGYKKEEEQNKARDFDKEFINTQLRKAISTQNSVESRIKSKVNNIQRTSAAMNANFARK